MPRRVVVVRMEMVRMKLVMRVMRVMKKMWGWQRRIVKAIEKGLRWRKLLQNLRKWLLLLLWWKRRRSNQNL